MGGWIVGSVSVNCHPTKNEPHLCWILTSFAEVMISSWPQSQPSSVIEDQLPLTNCTQASMWRMRGWIVGSESFNCHSTEDEPPSLLWPETCGDVAVHGFWPRGATVIFDIRVTDTDALRIASRLAAKWKRTYSEVCGLVRSRLATTLVKTTRLCLRGARDPTARASHATWDSGIGLSLYC